MCRNSNHGARVIALSFFAFVLLASPCFAQASWGGLFAPKSPTVRSQVVLKDSVRVSPVEFSQALSTNLSEQNDKLSYEELMAQLKELETEYIASQNEIANLSAWSESLKTQLEVFAKNEELSESEYKEVVNVVATLADRADKQTEAIAKQTAELESLKKDAGTRPFVRIGLIGLPLEKPNYFVSGSLGIKFRKHLMLDAGLVYDIDDCGDVSGMLGTDKFGFNVGASWMF